MCNPERVRSILRRCANVELEFIGKAKSAEAKTVPKKKKKRKQKKANKGCVRTFVVNGKKRTYRGPKIVVWEPQNSTAVDNVVEYSVAKVEAKNKEDFFNVWNYQDIEDVPPKKIPDLKFRDFKAGILRTNARRKEERKSSFPNVRRASRIEAALIRAEI